MFGRRLKRFRRLLTIRSDLAGTTAPEGEASKHHSGRHQHAGDCNRDYHLPKMEPNNKHVVAPDQKPEPESHRAQPYRDEAATDHSQNDSGGLRHHPLVFFPSHQALINFEWIYTE